jgi:hypothetical protein
VYLINTNSSFENQWTYACSIVDWGKRVRYHCPTCGGNASWPKAEFSVQVESGSEFPDFLLCGALPGLTIFSENTISCLSSAGIVDFETFQIQIVDSIDLEVNPANAPRYFRVEIGGRAMVDLIASGAESITSCDRCGRMKTKPSLLMKKKFFPGSWDGSDLFRDIRRFPAVTFCTQKFKDVIEQNRLTNFHFTKLPVYQTYEEAYPGSI